MIDMTSKLKYYVITLLLAAGLTGMNSTAHADDKLSFFSDIGIYNQYIKRGVPQGNGSSSTQGDLGIRHENGLSMAAWFATGAGINGTEYDVTLDYSGESGALGYSIGYYTISYTSNATKNGGELYAALSYDFISAAVYTAKTYNYYELAASYHMNDIIESSLVVGYDDLIRKTDITLRLSKDFEADLVTFTPSLAIIKLEGSKAELMFGLNASF